METFSRWKVRIKRKLLDSTARISEFSLRENRRNRKLRTRDDFAQSVLRRRRRRRRKDRTGSDIKNNGKEERCLRRVSRGAVASTKEAGGEEGKKARNRLTMKLQCNDLTAVFHLARLYVAFCPSNHGWILPPLPLQIYLRTSPREIACASTVTYRIYRIFSPEITFWGDCKFYIR